MDNQPQEQTRPEWEQAWAAMQQSPEFQAADDKEREAMRNSVYHNYIENRLPTRLKKKAKDMFDERTKPEGDPDSGILSDIFHMTGAGAVEAFADLAAAPTLGKSNRVSDWLSEKARDIESGASPSMIKEAQDFGVDYNAEQGLHLSEGSTFKGFMGAAFKGGGSMLSLAPAGVVGRGAGMALNAIGKAGKMEKALVATNNMANARKAMAIAERKMIDRATRASYGVTMGGQMGGGTGRQAELEVMEKSEEELKKSPQYNEYLKIMSPQQAREKLAGDAAESQFWPAAGLGTVSGMIVGPAMEEIAMGSKLGAKAVSRPMNALKGGVTEMGQEMVESGGQQILSNVAQQDVGLQVDTMAGVPKATLTGMAVGGVSGAAMGGAFKHKPPNREQIDQDLNDANVKVQALEADLKQPDLSDKDKATTEANLEKAYRRVVDLEGVQQSLIEAAEKQAKADAKKGKAPKPSEPETKPSESTAKPSESEPPADPNAPWVATDIDNQIADLSRDIRQQESNFKRTLQNGGKVEDAEILERQMGKQKALLNRLQSLSRHRDKQSLFDKKEDFYSWIDLTTGTPDDQVEASLLLRNQGRRKALEASVPGLARRAQAAAKRGAKGELLDQVADRKLARGIKAAMKEEQYQSLDESLPSHEDIKHEQKQIKRKELAHRVTESGAHRDPFRWKRRKEHRERELKRTRAVPETIAGFHTETTPKEFLVRSGQDHLKKFGPQGLGGLYDRRRGGWVFPRQRRTTVAKALEQWQPRPSGRPATRKPRYSTERISNLTNKPAQPATVTPIEEARAKTETPPAPVVESKPKQEKSVEPAVKKEKPATKEPPPVQKKEPVEKKVTPKPEEPPPRESTAKKSEKVPKEQPAAETKPKEPTPESKAFGTTKSAPDYEAREQVKQQSAANLRRKFLDQYVGNKGDAPYAFVGSLIHNDYEKALDDVHRERLTPDTAIATANKAVEAGAMDRESADWFIKKLKEQVPEVPETKSKEPVNTLSDKELEQGILDRTFNAFTDAMKEGTSKDDYRGGAKRLAQAIKDKNVEYLLTVLDQGRDGNKGSKAAFQWATGQEGVGLTAKANRDAVYRWAGWTEQQIEQRKQNRQKQLEEEARQRHEEHAVDLANRTSMRVDGVDMTIKEWVDKRLSEGFTELYNKGKKVPQYFLREPGTTSGYELSHFGKYKGAKGYSKIALDYARIAISRLDRHQPSNNGQIKQAEPHSVSTLRGDKTAIQDQIREGLLKGERFSDEYTTYWIEDRSQVKGGGWVMVTKPLDGGYGSTKGGTGRGAWSQQEAAGRVIQDMDYAITEASKNARMSLDDMGKDFKQELLEKARKFRDDLREGWFTSDQLRAKLHVFISDYIWQKAPEHIDLDEATPSALAKDLIYQLHREVTPKPTRLPEAANDWVHNDRYVWEYATKLIDHGFDPEPFYEVKDDMKKVREAIKKTITDFKETTTTQPTEATPQPTSIPDSFSQAFKEVTPDQPVTVIDLKGRAFQEAHTWLKTLTEERSPNHRRQWSYNDWVISTPTSGGINYFTITHKTAPYGEASARELQQKPVEKLKNKDRVQYRGKFGDVGNIGRIKADFYPDNGGPPVRVDLDQLERVKVEDRKEALNALDNAIRETAEQYPEYDAKAVTFHVGNMVIKRGGLLPFFDTTRELIGLAKDLGKDNKGFLIKRVREVIGEKQPTAKPAIHRDTEKIINNLQLMQSQLENFDMLIKGSVVDYVDNALMSWPVKQFRDTVASLKNLKGSRVAVSAIQALREVRQKMDKGEWKYSDVDWQSLRKAEPSRAAPRYGDLPTVKHTTKKGKELTGVVAKDLTKAQALEIDQGTFMKEGGWFLRKNRLDAYNERQQPEGTKDERATDHPRDTEGTGSLPEPEGSGAAGRHDVGLAAGNQPGVSGRSGRGKKEGTGQTEHTGSDPVDAAGQPVSKGDSTGPDHRGDSVPVRGENYRITDHSLAVERSWPDKARDNIAAIKILRQLAKENRPARPDEQAILVRYVGWGASELANNIFPVSHRQLTPEWQALADEVKGLLTEEEWKNAAKSVNYAHFTGAGIVNRMYQAIQRFGVKTGLTFEAGTGIGHFMGLAPTDMNLHYTGVELDPVSARIAQALYPGNGTLQADFIKMGLPENHYDLVLGNPPYMNLTVKNDPKYGSMGMQLHDYFIAKQIDALKPGGIGAFITSSRTLDKKGDTFRQYVNERANLIGAIRLPNTAFIQNAGAEVGTDILFFQKAGEGIPAMDSQWTRLGDHPTLREDVTDSEGHTNRQPVEVNQYFLDNPHMVLGSETMSSSQFGEKYAVESPVTRRKNESREDYLDRVEKQLQKDLNKAIKTLPRKLVKKNPSPEAIAKAAAKYDLNPKDKEDSFYIREDGSIGHVIDGVGESVPVRGKGVYSGLSKIQQQYVRDYIPLREAVMAVYRSQTGSEAEWKAAVADMERQYDAFVKKHGPVKQGKYIEQKRKDGKTIEILREPIISTLDMDPEAFRVAAIEDFDINTGEAKKTRIFTERILGIDPTPSIDSAQDAVSHTLNTTGWLDMDTVQQHYPDHTLADIVSELGDEIYRDPATGRYVVKDAYLSGNVKAKLRDAEQAAKDNPALERNVRALKEVIPADLTVSQVPMRMGSFWIPESVVARFAGEEMGISQPEIGKFRHREISSWKVNGFAMTSPFATRRVNATRMLAAALNQSDIKVMDEVWVDGNITKVTNSKESAIANAKKRELQDAFERWARNNGEVADTLAKIYNRDFNTNVNRKHDGSHLTFPGMSSRIKLRPHQANVVWRIIQEGNTYMAHAVGAGKTMASISAAMEMKRLGLVNKPTFAVLKSTLKQFAAEFLELYPNARILVADEKQLDAKNRRRFVAKIANENWDAVIMTHESFRSLPMSDAFIEQQIDQQIQELRDMLEDLDKSEGLTRKQIENRIGQLESKLGKMAEKATSRKDKGMSFEETGIDFLFIDEAHNHKKVGFPTRMGNLKGVDSDTSTRAQDLFMKTQYLESKRPGKHTVLMSGTPVSNTLGELFNIQRYLQPKVLENNQVSSFDGWVSNFATTVSNIEMQADGGFKEVTRLAKFVGVPGLMRDVLQIMDYVGMDEMREKGLVKLPQVNKGIKVTERSEGLRSYQQELGERIKAYENLTGKQKRSKGIDAIVKILNDGRMAAIDMRMVNRKQEGPSKLEDMIGNVFDHWQETRGNVYRGKDGEADSTPGGIQLIFSDFKRAYEFSGGPVTFDMFQYIKDSLVKRGIPADEIAFIHDYTNSVKKKRLFSDMNAGRKTILLGGSQDLGTGVNVQKRLTALHNLDINYVPAQMNQRLGRGERQGNQNPNVQNFLYVTEGTTDATVLQLNENKTRMSDQVMRGDFSIHEMEDVSTAGDELAQAKAIASGNPLLMEQAGVVSQYRQLAAQRDDHIDKMARYRANLNITTEVLASYERSLPEQEAMAKRYVSTRGDQFRGTVNGKTYNKRADFGERMLGQIEGSLTDKSPKPRKVAEIAGYDLFARYNPTTTKAELTFDPDNKDALAVAFRDGDDPLSPGGITARIENRAAELSELPRRTRNTMDMLKEDIVRYKKALKEKFPYQEQLDKIKQRLDEINRELEGTEEETTDTTTEKQPETETEGQYRLAPEGEKAKGLKGYQAKTLQNVLDKALGNPIKVVQSESQLPKHLQQQIARDRVQGRVKGLFDNGRLYLVADNASDLNDAMATALHELVGHKGVRALLGDGFDTTLDQVYRSIPKRVLPQLKKTYAGQLVGKSPLEQRRLLADEYLAHLAETNPQNGFVRQVIAKVAQWLRQYLPGLKMTQGEIRQLLIDSRASLREQRQLQEAGLRYRMDEDAVEQNIQKGIQAAKRVLKSHKDVTNAMYRPDLGYIDFPWGEEGKWPPNKRGVRKGQKGLAHIIEARMRKNELTEGEAKQVLFKVIETIAKGEIETDGPKPAMLNGREVMNERLRVKMGPYVAMLINEDVGNSNHYLLSGFKRSEDFASGETGKGHGKHSPTHNRPTPSRPAVGAEAKSTINDSTKQNQQEVMKEGRYKLDSVIKLDQETIATLKHKARSAYDLVRRGALGGLGGRQITEIYSHLFKKLEEKTGYNPLAHIDKLLQKMAGDRNTWVTKGSTIDKSWEQLASKHPEADKLLSTVMHESTLHQVDPRKPYTPVGEDIATLQDIVNKATSDRQKEIFTKKLKKEQARKDAHERLQKQWQTLKKTDGAQDLFTEVERFYKHQRAATKKALRKRLDAINLDSHAKGTALKQLEAMFAQDIKHGPYFPLQRFGEYVIVAKDAEGNPYRAHYESKYARDMAKQELMAEGYDITYAGMRAEFDPSSLAGVGQFSAGLIKALESKRNQFIDDEAKTHFLSEVNQLALSLLPEMSAAKHGMHRKGVAGYHENARRVFDSVALTNANRLSRLNYGWQIEAELSRIKEAVGEDTTDSPLSDHQRDVAMQVYNELRKRHTKIMNPDGNAFAAHLTNAGFFMYMGGSIGAGLVNMTQNLLIALPQLGAKHGFRKTAAAMAKAHKDIFAYGGKKPKGLNGLLDDAWFNLEHAEGKIPKDEVELIKALNADGTIETSQVSTMAQNADADMLPEKIKRRDWLTKASRASGMFFHNAEILNRQVAALTAYRLMKEKGKTKDLAPNNQPTEATLDAVRSAVLDAHYDYSSYNRPRYFKNNWAKVFLLFKQYSQNTSYFLSRNMYQALKGESPEVKKQAWKTLGSTLGMHGLFAGALGLPGVSVAMAIAGLAMGDEDDPVDPEVEFRKGLYNTMTGIFGEKNGKVIAHALSKGAFNAFTGVDVHSRTSVNDLWFRGTNYDMSARQEAMYYLTSAFAGPLPGLGVNAWAGVDKMKNGDYWQGLEAMVPKFIRDGMRAVRYTQEGAMDTSGNPLVQDFSASEIVMQGLGMGPARLSEAYTARNAYNRPVNQTTARKSLLLTQLDRAKTPTEKQKVMDRIDRYNAVQKERGKGWEWAIITPKVIRSSAKTRRKRKEEAVPGVGYVPSNRRGMLDEVGFAAY